MMTKVATAPNPRPKAALGELFSRLAAGDLEALEPIYDQCADELYGLALWRCGSRTEAEDAVQDVFVRLATTTTDLRAVRDPRAYLLTMVRRSACDQVRRRRASEPLDELLVESTRPQPQVAAEAAAATLALRRLPAEQREAVYLRHFLGLTFAEIAGVAKVPTFTAASRCRKGIEKLRALLGAGP
jgi:RNA polymerase sigma-70 factor (ECF subfamily)